MTERIAVGARARELAGIDAPDYADAFTVRAPVDRPAVDLARLAMDGAPTTLRVLLRVAQQGVLRLRLGPWRSPAHVIGWTVRDQRPGEVLLGADGPLLCLRLVLEIADDDVTVTTLVRHERPVGRALWTAVAAPVHRAVTRYLLARTARLVAA